MEEKQDIKKLRLLATLSSFIKDRFNLDSDKADDQETIEYIKKGVDFRGPNVWILIFAIFIASIGLNVNSTAVIIGAMLISPLMGPILGIGLGVGINDLDLLKRAFKNLAIATVVSIVTSTIYFSVSPLSDAQSELLARTTPTIWDVLIAFFGGLAGIVAGSRKEKSNAIPGVAIATALMPPLCTAGYGLAIGNYYYFLGAFYLYFINSVFISLATLLIVRVLRYPKKSYLDEATARRTRALITFFTIITIIPSIYLGYGVVKRSIFERNASLFITQELNFDQCRVISKVVNFDTEPRRIEVSLFGEPVDENLIENAREKLEQYDLNKTELIVFQGYNAGLEQSTLENTFRSSVIEELYKQNQDLIESKDKKIKLLEDELTKLKATNFTSQALAGEVKALYPTLKEFSINRTLVTSLDSMKQDTTYLVFMKFQRRPYRSDLKRLEDWLKAKTNSEKVRIILE